MIPFWLLCIFGTSSIAVEEEKIGSVSWPRCTFLFLSGWITVPAFIISAVMLRLDAALALAEGKTKEGENDGA
jgi:hypothetical protein